MTKKVKKVRYEPEPKGVDPSLMMFIGAGALIIALLSGGLGYMLGKGTGSVNPTTQAGDNQANRNQQIQQQITDLQKKLEQNPNSIPDLLTLGHLYLDSNQVDLAEPVYQKVLTLDSRNAEAITHIGNVAQSRDQNTEALSKYDDALNIQPDYVHALYDQGTLYRVLGRNAEAIAVFEKFLKLMPPDGQDAARVKTWLSELRAGTNAPSANP